MTTKLNDLLPTTPDIQAERLEELKRLFPDIFDGEGRLKLDDIKQIVGDEPQCRERYDFSWYGKRNAKAKAYEPTTATLSYDEQRSVNPEKADGNIIIEGENLESLKTLLAAYRESIKCIYIDPPYNTGKDFVYSDNYTEDKKAYWEDTGSLEEGVKVDTNPETAGRYHSNWLFMMYSRLLLARQLLKDDGVVFVSIDDNEVHNLRRLMDEVFGEEQFIAQLIWKSRQNIDNRTQNGASIDHEYVICYGDRIRGRERDITQYSNPDDDKRGKWASANMVGLATADRRPNLHYDLINSDTGVNYGCPSMGWRYDKNTMATLVSENRILWPKDDTGRPRKKAFLSEISSQYTGFSSIIGKGIYTKHGTQNVDVIFNSRIMDFPKPTELLTEILEQGAERNDIVLDFFAGSGTTAQAILEHNQKDNGNRKFILVQLPEQTPEKSEARKAGYKKISDITIERVKRVIEGYGDNPQPIDTGFKVYKLTKSHFPRTDFKPNPEKSEAENIEALKQYIAEKEKQLIGLFEATEIQDEVLLKNGFKLNYQLTDAKEFTANNIKLADDGEKQSLLCLDTKLQPETVNYLLQNPQNFICLETSLATSDKWNLRHHLRHRFIAF